MIYPGLASWAKLNRPCGTKFVNPGSLLNLPAAAGLEDAASKN
jgi:hypothetical protein